MKTKLFTNLLLSVLAIGFFSCDKSEIDQLNKQIELEELQSYTVSPGSYRRITTENTPYCPQVFELWYDVPTYWGSVEVYNDGTDLVVKIMIDAANHPGWELEQTWLVLSPTKYWGDGQPAWGSDPNIRRDPNLSGTSIELKEPLEEWMIQDCFYIGIKVLLVNGSEEIRIRAYLNIDGNLSGAWENPICLCHPGTGTPGYWKNHPEAWPIETIDFGCNEGGEYAKEEAIELMKHATKGDKTYNMFEQLVAAILNVEAGNVHDCIDATIADAMEWMCDHPVGENGGVTADSEEWEEGGPLHEMLDDYNNGLLCAEHRD